MPTEQGIGLHEEPIELPSGEQSAEVGKECSVRRLQSRAVHLATENRHLVTEHDDLDGQIGDLGPLQSEDLHGPEEGEIEERESHGPCSRSQPLRRKSQLNVPDEVLGTHRIAGPDSPTLVIFATHTAGSSSSIAAARVSPDVDRPEFVVHLPE
jgi:hypothetical protein